MDAPPVQYARTGDGFSIAYTVSGQGMPLLLMPWGLNDIMSVWASHRAWMEGLAERFRLVQLDIRGRGLSSRGLRPEFSIHDPEIDVSAVVDNLDLESFVIFSVGGLSHVGIRYAIAHPERVLALVINTCPISISSYPRSTTQGLAAENWPYYVRLNQPPELSGDSAEQWLQRWLSKATYDDWLVSSAVSSRSDVRSDLASVQVPTLVMHSRAFPVFGPEESMELAAGIPSARFVLINGNTMGTDPAEGLGALDAFLGEIVKQAPAPRVESQLIAPNPLSHREIEVLRLLAAGRSNQQIADELVISLNTVRRHVSNIFDKTGAANRAQAAVYARDHGLA